MLLGRGFNERVRRLVGGALVGGEHDDCQACPVGDLPALVWEVEPVDHSFPLGEHLLHLGADTFFHAR